MSSSRAGKRKVVYNLELAATEIQTLISDPVNYEQMRDLVDHVKDNYTRPVNSWLTFWWYWFTRGRVGLIKSVSDIVNNPEYNPEAVLKCVSNIFSSKGGWKSTSLNTFLMSALLQMLVETQGYDAQEVITQDNLFHLRDLLLISMDEKIQEIKKERQLTLLLETRRLERFAELEKTMEGGRSASRLEGEAALRRLLGKDEKSEAERLAEFRQSVAPSPKKLNKNLLQLVIDMYEPQKKVIKVEALTMHPELSQHLASVRESFHTTLSSSRAGFFNANLLKKCPIQIPSPARRRGNMV